MVPYCLEFIIFIVKHGVTNVKGCIKRTCNNGRWVKEIDDTVCCYSGEDLEFEMIKTAISQLLGNGTCSGHVKQKHVEEIKQLLREHMSESGRNKVLHAMLLRMIFSRKNKL